MSSALQSALLATKMPVVGRSTQGRPLLARLFGGGGAGGPLVVVAGVHGDEPSSVEAALELARALDEGEAPARAVWIWPALNPDGLAAGRKNSSRDVDLNRNFPARSFSAAHEPGYSPGEAPLSEPETRAFAEFLEQIRPVGVVAVHAPFACVNYDGPAAGWAAEVAASCGWPVRESIGYPTPGSLGSWLGVDRGLPVLTLELPGGPYEPFATRARAALQTAINPKNLG
jgi:murein peptide amidase A